MVALVVWMSREGLQVRVEIFIRGRIVEAGIYLVSLGRFWLKNFCTKVV